MSQAQSLPTPTSCDSGDESRGVSIQVRVGLTPKQDAGSEEEGRGRLPSPSGRLVNSAEHGKIKPLRAPTKLARDEDYDSESESEAEETEYSSSSESEAPASGTFDDDTLCDSDFNLRGADLYLKAGNRHFWVHSHVLRDFKSLESRLNDVSMEEEEGHKLLVLKDSAEDVHNILLALYTKPYEPHDFNNKILESCLNLATKYDNPGLRKYAIQRLEECSLEAIDQFRLGRDHSLPGWRTESICTLSTREQPLTEAESTILGPAMFSSIAAAREKYQYAKGHREGAALAPPTDGVSDTPGTASATQQSRVTVRPKVVLKSGSKEPSEVQPSVCCPSANEFAPRLPGLL